MNLDTRRSFEMGNGAIRRQRHVVETSARPDITNTPSAGEAARDSLFEDRLKELQAREDQVSERERIAVGLELKLQSRLSQFTDISKKVHSNIQAGSRKRRESFISQVFATYKDGPDNISKSRVPLALTEAGVKDFHIPAVLDSVSDGGVDFVEFKRLIREPSPLEQWTGSLPIALVLADALHAICDREGDPLRLVSCMTQDEMDAVCEGLLLGIKAILSESVQTLKSAFAAMDDMTKQSNAKASKFQVFTMNCGKIDDFHQGLHGRIGSPHLQFREAMEAEHCRKAGSSTEFKTSNYAITTTPAREWALVVDRAPCRPEDMGHGRRIPDPAELLDTQVARDAGLWLEEVIAVSLYTGPMFMVYNAILRRHPPETYALFEGGGNLYPTTISVLVSAVQKVARAARVPEGLQLYRGLGGLMDLPDGFARADARGCRGFAEWGFMSTTADKAVALQYSGVREGRPRAAVLAVTAGAVDRGACVRELSQYPAETEYLWVPCSYLQPAGPRRLEATADGVVAVVPVRVNANLRAATVEEIVGRKREMHLAAFDFLLDEVRRDLDAAARGGGAEARLAADASPDARRGPAGVRRLLRRIADQCGEVRARHGAAAAADYARDEAYRGLVGEMLEAKAFALSKLRWWLEDPSQFVSFMHDMALRTAHRGRLAFLERTLPPAGAPGAEAAAAALCRARGLVRAGVAEENELGETPIMCAAAEGWAARDLRLLVAAGADVNGRNGKGKGAAALHAAAQNGNAECAAALVALRADPNQGNDNGATPLYMAAQGGHVGCLEALAAAGGDVDAARGDGWTPAAIAAWKGHAECLAALARLGADLRRACRDGRTPVHIAVQAGRAACVRALFELGAGPGGGDGGGEGGGDAAPATPGKGGLEALLRTAAAESNAECVRYLVGRGADVNAALARSRKTPLHAAAGRGAADVVAALLDAAADPAAADSAGQTALMLAVLQRHWEAAQLLAGRGGADLLRVRDDDGWTCLHYAVDDGRAKAAGEIAALAAGAAAGADLLAEVERELAAAGAAAGGLDRVRGAAGAVRVNRGARTATFTAFASARAPLRCPPGGKGYYELEIVRLGPSPQWGFCADGWPPAGGQAKHGVGDDGLSWGVDGARGSLWHCGRAGPYAVRWRAGDVIGLACDLAAGRLLVSVGGDWAAPHGAVLDLPAGPAGMLPALSCGGSKVRYNFGTAPFRHAPPAADFQPFAALESVGPAAGAVGSAGSVQPPDGSTGPVT